MFIFIKNFFTGLLSVCTMGNYAESLTSTSKGTIKCVSLTNQPFQAKPTNVDIESDETDFYPFNVSVNKCGGSCNTVDDLYAWVSFPNKVKNINARYLISYQG